jgi:hypothetical protein
MRLSRPCTPPLPVSSGAWCQYRTTTFYTTSSCVGRCVGRCVGACVVGIEYSSNTPTHTRTHTITMFMGSPKLDPGFASGLGGRPGLDEARSMEIPARVWLEIWDPRGPGTCVMHASQARQRERISSAFLGMREMQFHQTPSISTCGRKTNIHHFMWLHMHSDCNNERKVPQFV